MRLTDDDLKGIPTFPILRGESVGEDGEFSGKVVIVSSVEDLEREWKSDEIAVLHHKIESHLQENPGLLDSLFKQVSAVLSEFGEAFGKFSSIAHEREAIAIVKVEDACYVLENGMFISMYTHERVGDIFFIE